VTLARLLVLAALAAAGCSNKIGDECKTSADCSQEQERSCDISQPGGYCTIEGCDERSCPEDSACIRFFPRMHLLTKGCGDAASECAPDEICVGSGDAARCAPRSSERRYCAATCDDDDDCRGGYECRTAGTEGSLALTKRPERTVRFCAPTGR
jgi:hypothetical protein